MTSTSLDSVDSEADYKWDSATYPVPFFFHPLISFMQLAATYPCCIQLAILEQSQTLCSVPQGVLSKCCQTISMCVYFHSVAALCTHLREPVFNLYQNVFQMKQNSRPQQNHWHMTRAFCSKSWCARLLSDSKLYSWILLQSTTLNKWLQIWPQNLQSSSLLSSSSGSSSPCQLPLSSFPYSSCLFVHPGNACFSHLSLALPTYSTSV